MSEYEYIDLMKKPELKNVAAKWFHEMWGVPEEAYLSCMEEYLSGATKNGWYLCLDGEKIVIRPAVEGVFAFLTGFGV